MSDPIKSNRWFAQRHPVPQARLRLFCFPYSGGNASLFYAWQDNLPPDIEVCPVQLPGRGTRIGEPPFTQLAPLVQAIAMAMLPLLDKPFAFFGHSLGALLIFELARYLRRHYRISPVHLIASGHGAPHLSDPHSPIYDLPDAEFIAKLREFKGTPTQVLENAELLQIVLPILRADFEMCETYQYSTDARLDCSISAFGGLDDEYVSRHEIEGWREQTSAAFAMHMVQGDHFFIHTARASVLRLIAQELASIIKTNGLEKGAYAFRYSMATAAEHIAP